MMQEEIPYFIGDSAMIYRMLQDLEQEGAVEVTWNIPDSGRPIKYYNLTAKGWGQLLEAEEDIRNRTENHIFFLRELEKEKNRRNNA